MERLVKKAKVEATIKDFIEQCQQKAEQFDKVWESVLNETTSLIKLNEIELLDLFRLFELPVSIHTALNIYHKKPTVTITVFKLYKIYQKAQNFW